MKPRHDKFRSAIFERAERRLRRARPGSVLILVVALLVLLALLGTAYINTAQSDRYSAAQNSFNTEIELLLQGVEEMTRTAAVDAVFSSSTGTPTTYTFHLDTATTQPSTQYAITDYPNNKPSTFIGDRYPSLVTPAASASATNFPYWNFISALPSNATFESPYVNSSNSPPTPPGVSGAGTYVNRTQMAPTSVQWQVTDSSGTHTVTYPALQFQITSQGNTTTYLALAGDADGDGIADCALFRLPIGQLNGVTYYGGVRVVDNCAAINAAIAIGPQWQSSSLGLSPSALPGSFFPTNIDLNDLLVSGDQLTGFNTNARFNSQMAPTLMPYDDYGNLRNDFNFGSSYEAFWMQVGRRLANPGYYSTNTSSQYTALPQSEMATMASRFILHDPSITNTNYTTSSSSLEKYLYNSCVLNSPSTPYTPDKYLTWAQQNFDFANTSATVPLRSMLVTQNGVSNFTYSKLHNPGSTGTTVATTPAVWSSSATYNFGDWVTFTSPSYMDPTTSQSTTMTRTYVCMQQNSGQTPTMSGATPPVPTSSAYWEPQPWTTGPTKASANTATFGQLWTAYYSAMTESPITSTSLGGVTTAASQAMFRSSLRTGSATTLAWTPTLTPAPNTNYSTTGLGFPEMQLRAAIAAINTLELRNPNSVSPTAPPLQATIKLTNASGAPAFTATVYGSAPQPYITEVYASSIGGTPYVAVELYNPYPFAIPMATWQLATVQRTNGATSLPTLTPIAWGGTAPTVPANGFVVLASSSTPPSYITTPPAGTPTLVPNLASALDNELVLLRPALMPNTGSFFGASFTATVPVDSYDFTGLKPTADPATQADWHYIRPNASAANGVATAYKNWHFVYPGTYKQIAGDFQNPREAGTMPGAPGTPQTTSLASMGAPDAAATVGATTYFDRPLQITNTGFAGANKTTASGNTFPYGGFARNADLLQVTYIGAYQVTSPDGNTLYELNALPADSAMADDPSLINGLPAITVPSEQLGRQNIGRFTPVNWADTIVSSGGAPPVYSQAYGSEVAAYQAGHPAVTPPAAVLVPDDYWTPDTTLQTGYHWTFRLFDYITTQSPQDDYLPDVDPATGIYSPPATTTPATVANANKTIANAASTNEPPSATEETVPVHGRININTANWRVLATLPFFDKPYNAAAAADLARAIVYYRDVDDGTGTSGQAHPHGAFQSIEELNNVVVAPGSNPTTLSAYTSFRTAFGAYLGTFVVPGLHGSNADGDLSPYTPASATTLAATGQDLVYGDFENQNLALNRISNLITTRSDSFTAYVLVQGWRNVGTASPTLVVQRRGAFILDRSTITPLNNTQPAIVNIPTQ
jgi:hypothetical protein